MEWFIVSGGDGVWGLRGGFEYMYEWAKSPLSQHVRGERSEACIFGCITCLYTVAWYHGVIGEVAESLNLLYLASNLLHFGQLDWTEHSGWPVTSWHVAVNVYRLERGLDFVPLPRAPTPSDPRGLLVPSVWPRPVPQPKIWARSVRVFYVAMHVVPFSDVLAFLSDWWEPAGGADAREGPAVRIHTNYMGYPRCCPSAPGACSEELSAEGEKMQGDWRIPYCSKDPRLYHLLRIPLLHDHSDGQWANAYRSHELDSWAETVARFEAEYYPWLEENVDLVLCGHPLLWCTLFEALVRKSARKAMIAVYDQPPFFLVPGEAEETFAGTLRDFADQDLLPNVVVVGFAPFFARQFEWLLGRRIPHSRPIALVVKDTWQPLKRTKQKQRKC